MQTRAQKNSKQAYEHISQLQLSGTDAKLYGSICHTFPIMVLRSGLAQSVAFLWIKAESDKPAYQTFLKHLSLISNGPSNETYKDFQQRIQEMDLAEYQRTTRTILNASVWYKRFAESMLNVKAGEDEAIAESGQENSNA
jgi:CRISPR-associated protein Cmr5